MYKITSTFRFVYSTYVKKTARIDALDYICIVFGHTESAVGVGYLGL